MYLIDGHNLIPKIPGMSLRAVDDELALIRLLQTYARNRRRSIEVYFDDAPPGQAGTRTYGAIRAHFVSAASDADSAIRRRLQEMGRKARNATVVTSDRQVQAEARARQAAVIPSEDFARELLDAQQESAAPHAPAAQPSIPQAEVEEWLRIFQSRPSLPPDPEPPPRPKPQKPRVKPKKKSGRNH